MNEDTRKKLDDLYTKLQSEPAGYPDPLDLLGLLERNPELPETIDFWEFRKAYDWLSETAHQNHSNGRHLFLDGEELAHRAGCSLNVLVAAATQLNMKRFRGTRAAFKFPPFKLRCDCQECKTASPVRSRF
jgi:hypothetical protein